MTTVGVWLLILCTSCSIEDPFAVTDLIVSIVGTIAVFLMPVLCWMQINGGFVYVFTLGICGQFDYKNQSNKKVIDIHDRERVRSRGHSSIDTELDTEIEKSKASVIQMLFAQYVFWLSCAFIIIGVTISSMEIYQKFIINKGGISWRQALSEFPRA